MNVPLITWCCIAAIFIAIVLFKSLRAISRRHGSHHPVIEIGQEWEEFYLPGDLIIKDKNDSDILDEY